MFYNGGLIRRVNKKNKNVTPSKTATFISTEFIQLNLQDGLKSFGLNPNLIYLLKRMQRLLHLFMKNIQFVTVGKR